MAKIQQIKSYYEPNIREGLEDYKILGWESEEAQMMRFEVLTTNLNLYDKKILDVGCGLGNLFEYLNYNNIKVHYTGVDILPKMIECAKQKELDAEFHCLDIFDSHPFPDKNFNIAYSSGIFNLNLGNNKEFLIQAIKELYELTSEAIVFNLLHHKSLDKEDRYFYFNPEEVKKIIEGLPVEFKKIQFVEKYLHNDFTVICYL